MLLAFIAITCGIVAGSVMGYIFVQAELRDRRVRREQWQQEAHRVHFDPRNQDADDRVFWDLVNSSNWVD